MADDNNKVKTEEEMTDEERQALQASEEFILNFKDEDMDDEEKRGELQKALANARTTVHQKKHYREKVGELSTELKKFTDKNGDGNGNGNEAPAAPAAGADNAPQSVAMIEFRQDHPSLTKEAVKEIFQYAAANKTTPDEALKSPVITAYLKSLETKADVEDASVAPNAPSATGIEKRDWSRATPKEIEAHRASIMAGGQ